MATLKFFAVLLIFVSFTVTAQQRDGLEPPTVVSLLSMELQDSPGKEALMITVEYPPGGGDPVHRHDAHAFVYVLEGSIIMQVKGGKRLTLTQGQTYYEGPDDLHTVGQNASSTKPAKFLVLLVKDIGVAPVLPAE
jgi:quercetin dioxygenase-like cupin family protein